MKSKFDVPALRRLRGILRLAEAVAEADAVNADVWQYAVPIDVLRNQSGLTNFDVQWLVNQRLTEHRLETTSSRGKRRAFVLRGEFDPSTRVCFVPSRAGLRLARRATDAMNARAPDANIKPHWNATTGDLTWDGSLVKHLPENATAQRAVLDRCQLENWSGLISSPFAAMPPKERSHCLGQVLNHLNSAQKEARLHFSSADKARCVRCRVEGHA